MRNAREWALAAAVLLLGMTGAAWAQGEPDFRMTVGVDVSGLHPAITSVQVQYEVNNGPATGSLGFGSHEFAVMDGAVAAVQTIDISLRNPAQLAEATHWRCALNQMDGPNHRCILGAPAPPGDPCAVEDDVSARFREGQF
jgi:hypothetical protein